MAIPGGSDNKESACYAGDLGLILGSGRSPGEGNGNPLQYSCLENPIDRGAWQATVHGITKSWTWSFSRVLLFVTPWTVALQAPLSMVFQARIVEWVAISSLGDLPNPGQDPTSPALAGKFFTTSATWEAL